MSDFFDTLTAAAKRTVSSVTNEVSIAAEEQRIREIYRTLGRLYFKAQRSGKPTDSPEIRDCCKRIEASLKRIQELKQSTRVSDVYAEETDFAEE